MQKHFYLQLHSKLANSDGNLHRTKVAGDLTTSYQF
jgi:hypothetical protein